MVELFWYLVFCFLFGLAYLYSPKDQWGIYERYYSENKTGKIKAVKFILGFLLGAAASLVLYLLNWWLVMFGGVAFAAIAVVVYKEKFRKYWKHALILGIYLMVSDWVIENAGAMLGYWFSYNSIFFVGAVPLEVMVAALGGGIGYGLMLPKKWDTKYLTLASLIPAVGGLMGEAKLQLIGNMAYGNGWFWPHAMVAYFLSWVVLSFLWYKVILRSK
jgi:hypothetical protein